MSEIKSYHNPVTGYKWHVREVLTELGLRPVKVIEHPGVYLLSFMTLHEDNVDEFLRDNQITKFSPWGIDSDGGFSRNERGTDHELLVELSGRLCYMSYDRPRPGGLEKFLDNLKSESHGSVAEHPHYSFILSGVSRNMTLEANRHRTLSISQLSGRFVDAAEVGFVADPDTLDSPDINSWAKSCRAAFDEYESEYARNYNRQLRKWWQETSVDQSPTPQPDKQIERKLIKKARERARDILPGCLETRVLYTVNARAIRFIFEKRCHADAAFEIRRAFNGVYRALKAHDPKLFSDFTETSLPDGTFAVSTPYPKI